MNKFVITTCKTYPIPPDNLLPLANVLNRKAIPCLFQPWQDVQKKQIILPLCAWDYAIYPNEFRDWINQSYQQGSHFINSPELMLWNMHKSYLIDLQKKGINVIPTKYLIDPNDILPTIKQQQWQEVVIKPAIGQSGQFVLKYNPNDPLPDLSLYSSGIILQPYIAEVASNGEISLIFFNGNFSHAVKRQPKQGDFRANSAYGVSIIPISTSEKIIQQARQVLDVLPEIPVYARVDGTIINSELLLNELELIEPALYLHTTENATETFAEILSEIAGKISSNHLI